MLFVNLVFNYLDKKYGVPILFFENLTRGTSYCDI